MKQETGRYVGISAGALRRGGSAGLGVITERKPDIAVGRRTHLMRIRHETVQTSTNTDMQVPAHITYKSRRCDC